mmetsp:Transcript_7632/g.26270  ORF Transcript_7632/g.26270 Transcript_7632/m.26270 type:complete len:293 (-) Transcript_7632:2542-3420(-)
MPDDLDEVNANLIHDCYHSTLHCGNLLVLSEELLRLVQVQSNNFFSVREERGGHGQRVDEHSSQGHSLPHCLSRLHDLLGGGLRSGPQVWNDLRGKDHRDVSALHSALHLLRVVHQHLRNNDFQDVFQLYALHRPRAQGNDLGLVVDDKSHDVLRRCPRPDVLHDVHIRPLGPCKLAAERGQLKKVDQVALRIKHHKSRREALAAVLGRTPDAGHDVLLPAVPLGSTQVELPRRHRQELPHLVAQNLAEVPLGLVSQRIPHFQLHSGKQMVVYRLMQDLLPVPVPIMVFRFC